MKSANGNAQRERISTTVRDVKSNPSDGSKKVAVDIGELEAKAQRVLEAKQGVKSLLGRMEAIMAEVTTLGNNTINEIAARHNAALGSIQASSAEARKLIAADRMQAVQVFQTQVQAIVKNAIRQLHGALDEADRRGY